MEHQDYLMRQIEQLGRALGKILSDLAGLKRTGRVSEGIEATHQSLKGELDLDTEEIANLPLENFMETLLANKGFNIGNLDKLADILLFIADSRQDPDRKKLYEKCLAIYEYAEKAERVYSLDRQQKMGRVRRMIEEV